MDLGLDQLSGHLEKFSKLPRVYRIATLPIIAALVLGGYVYFLYQPNHARLVAVQDQQHKLQRQLREVQAVAANVGSFEEEIAALEKKLTVALRQLPNSKELPVLLTDISSLGKNAGLDFKAFRPGAEVRKDFYAEVPIQIEFLGGFHEVVRFFDEVAQLPRIVNVGQLDMAIENEDTVNTLLRVRGEARTFRFLEESKPAASAADQGRG